ncbi:MAG: hypothetical protein ACJAXJ_003730 [Colwellia sp.]|jgi:hypothetical protein|tara:strand:- start:6913 stop:7392 length:480 start_codon:yes stop_codon:yes gene_type:complete
MKSNVEDTSKTNNEIIGVKPKWLVNFIDNYSQLSTDNLELLENIYHKDITFIDPLHKVQGFENLQQYFYGLYESLTSCCFTIDHLFEENNEAAIYWTMSYQHPKLNSGKLVIVKGHSHIKGENEKVIYHRDYLDAGVMLYEQLPFIGRVIQWIKAKAAK